MNHDHVWRYTFLGALVSFFPALIIFRMVLIQANPAQVQEFLKQGSRYSGEYHTIYPARGEILDRWGHVLAANKMVYEVGIELQDVKSPETIAMTASLILGVDYEDALVAATPVEGDGRVYAVLANNVPQDKIAHLKILIEKMSEAYLADPGPNTPTLRGVVYRQHLQRTYPEHSLASNILGFVSGEGRGYFGVEEKYNELLAGTPKVVWVPLDPNRAQEIPSVPDGASLVLTIDRSVQQAMEEVIDEAIADSGAQSGTIVVMQPETGEILAMATTPRLDLNEYWHYGEIYNKDVPFNRGISYAYEPGSVYKVLTMAAGLDTGAVGEETSFLDTGVFEIGGTFIRNWDGGAWGPQTMQGCMQHSLNVCLAWIATQTGPRDFYRYMQAFGIGRLTGVDMAGEAQGRLKTPGDGDWYDADLGTNSFGQGVSATPLQMAVAISSVANDGKLMAPHVVRSMVNKGYQHDMEQRVIGTPLRPETAHKLTEMLAKSLETESSDALVTGYRVAGKTGTAEIPTPYGYTSDATNASFVGWGPADDPKFLVYVWLEKPASSPWGSVVAAPVFREAVEKLVVLLKIPPDEVRQQLYPQPAEVNSAEVNSAEVNAAQ